MNNLTELTNRIKSRIARVCVIGLGYVGWTLARAVSGVGFYTVGIDVSADRIGALKTQSHSVGLTTDYSNVHGAGVIVVCVSTPLHNDKTPDLSHIVDATEQIAKHLRGGQLVILESTTYPNTTEQVVLPILEKSSLKVGSDFFLAYSPERIDAGNVVYTLENTPKVVGGITPNCTELATRFYQQFVDRVVPVSSTQTAEMVKLLENTYRYVNIGLINEVAMLCDKMGLDVHEIVKAAATKPYGFMPFYPGCGVGGQCIPVDPFYLAWAAKDYRVPMQFVKLSDRVNSGMPGYVVGKVIDELREKGISVVGAKILVVGVAYKKNVGDVCNSPALEVMRLLSEKCAVLSYIDPYIDEITVGGKVYTTKHQLTEQMVSDYDCVLILTRHDGLDYEKITEHAELVVGV